MPTLSRLHRAVLLLLAALVLMAAAGCSGPAATQPTGPTTSVQEQLAQLAAEAQAVASAQPQATVTTPAMEATATRAAAATRVSAEAAPTLAPSPTRTRKPGAAKTPTPTRRPARTPAAPPKDGLPTIALAQLPKEARDTIRLIQQGGPFPYQRDGITFGNREGLLPKHPNGYYREYTVITPGSADRGARRIIAGQDGELYYTDDHYNSFRRVVQ